MRKIRNGSQPGFQPLSRTSTGQAITEFALVVPVALLLIWGIIEVAHVLVVLNTVSLASREASRYAVGMDSIAGEGTPTHWQDCAGIRDAAIRVGSISGINANNVHIFYDTGPSTTQTEICVPAHPMLSFVSLGDRISVRVQIDYVPLVKVIDFPSFPISAVSSHTIMMEIPAVE